MLTPFDDYPLHQTPLPVAHAGGGHPDFYDRFWFNGYTEDYYFAVALGIYPNRGIIDAAFAVVHDGWQRSVFASGRMPVDPTRTRVGPVSIDITEPLRVNRVHVEAADLGITADLEFRARTAVFSEPRQTLLDGTRPVMDVTRLAQLGQWKGAIGLPQASLALGADAVYGTKDRSWGIRPVGQPAPAAPARTVPQIFFLWAPLNFAEECLHFMTFEHADGTAWAKTAAVLPVIGPDEPVYGPGTDAELIEGGRAPGALGARAAPQRGGHAHAEPGRAAGDGPAGAAADVPDARRRLPAPHLGTRPLARRARRGRRGAQGHRTRHPRPQLHPRPAGGPRHLGRADWAGST